MLPNSETALRFSSAWAVMATALSASAPAIRRKLFFMERVPRAERLPPGGRAVQSWGPPGRQARTRSMGGGRLRAGVSHRPPELPHDKGNAPPHAANTVAHPLPEPRSLLHQQAP